MRLAAVVLDMDGLMLDTEPIYRAAWQQAARELGYELDDRAYLNLVGRRNEDSERALVRHFGARFPLAQFRSRWPELWHSHINDAGIPVKKGLLELLTFVEGHHLPIAVATSSDRAYTETTLRHAGLLERFGVIVTGEQVALGKPAPDIYLEAARRLGVDPTQSVALEDSDAGILAASRAGMLSLLIPDLKQPSAQAATAAFRVLASLDDARQLLAMLLQEGTTGRWR